MNCFVAILLLLGICTMTATSTAQSLPAHWKEVVLPDGKSYFFNGITGTSQWDPPRFETDSVETIVPLSRYLQRSRRKKSPEQAPQTQTTSSREHHDFKSVLMPNPVNSAENVLNATLVATFSQSIRQLVMYSHVLQARLDGEIENRLILAENLELMENSFRTMKNDCRSLAEQLQHERELCDRLSRWKRQKLKQLRLMRKEHDELREELVTLRKERELSLQSESPAVVSRPGEFPGNDSSLGRGDAKASPTRSDRNRLLRWPLLFSRSDDGEADRLRKELAVLSDEHERLRGRVALQGRLLEERGSFIRDYQDELSREHEESQGRARALDGLNRTACQLVEERAALLSRLRGSELAAEQWREKFDESLGRLADLAERQERINQTLAQLQRRSFVFLLLGDQLLQSLLACEELLEDREDAIVRLGSSLVALSEDYHRLLAQHQDLQRVLAVQTVESSLGSISPLRSVQLFLAGVVKGVLRLLWR